LDEVDIHIDSLLASTIRMVQGRRDAASVSVQYVASDKSLCIRGDKRLVKQILLNLLANAMKYNLENGSITVTTNINSEGALRIVVADTGVGIAAEDIPSVLEPFGQARSNAHLTHEGTGLGLSLSKQLVELHGGTLDLESAIGLGTTVTVTFPSERVLTTGERNA